MDGLLWTGGPQDCIHGLPDRPYALVSQDSPKDMPDYSTEPRTPDEMDRTLIETPAASAPQADAGPIHVSWLADGHERRKTFTDAFVIGRDATCDVCFDDAGVSRQHARVYPENGIWHVADMDSGNGSFLDFVRIRDAVLPVAATLQLGSSGPRLRISVPNATDAITGEQIAARYLGDATSADFGDRTQQIRNAFQAASRRKRRPYVAAIALVAVVAIGIGAYAWQQRQELQQARELATDIFYQMKAVELRVARIEDAIGDAADPELQAEIVSSRAQVQALSERYDRYLTELDILGGDLDETDRLIFKVARMFGECELTMPEGFRQEVRKYIDKWRRSARLRYSMERLQQKGLAEPIATALLDNHLPPQFLYLALQESGFRDAAVGPRTRFGIAKGMWQFIPTTAHRYDLRTGPLVELPVYDPNDERFDPIRSAEAAARYLHDIYNREAQASGLLVMASYNWGEGNVRRLINAMPENPRERNFWRLLRDHDIPRETYDYVMLIVSAIVIGENPQLFGFKFDNPLANLGARLQLPGATNAPQPDDQDV